MRGMLRAGLIGLLVGGVLSVGITLLFPPCTPCAAVFVGLGGGFLACMWERPPTAESGAVLAAKSGAIAGAGSLAGQMLGMLANGLLVGPEGATEAARTLGLPSTQLTPATYWTYQIVLNSLCGLTSLIIGAALGALGGFLWYQMAARKQAPQ